MQLTVLRGLVVSKPRVTGGATLRSLEDKKRTSEASCSFSRSSGDIGGQTAVDIVGGADGCEGFAICYWLAACWAHVPP